jgi:sulfite exporter TauE/SafE
VGRRRRRTVDLAGAINPAYAASGFGVGVLVGLTGVGGGSLITPLLVLLFGIRVPTAVGTDLLFAAATVALGAVIGVLVTITSVGPGAIGITVLVLP